MSFAIIQIGGKQVKVKEKETFKTELLHAEPGESVTVNEVLLVHDKDTHIGTPHVTGASVVLKVIKHGKAAKVGVFKMIKRKRYRRTRGHRQQFTAVEVTKITGA